MRVLMYCLSSVSGGAVSYLRNVVPLLVKQFEESGESHSLHILAHESQREVLPSIPDAQCVWIGGTRPAGWRRILWERQNMARIARETNTDVLFTPYQIGPRVEGLKQVLMLRNMEPFLFGGYRYSPRTWLRNHLLHWQSLHALRRADRVIAVSGFAEEQMRNGLGIPPERIRRVYHGRDTAFSPDGDSDEDRDCLEAIGVEGDFLLTCGSLLPYRRCEDAIAAFNQCAGLLSAEMRLVIAGSGTDRRYGKLIQRAIASSPYCDRILAVGHVSTEMMKALYRRCRVCVIATEIEACPNIAIEAMSSGCAIISSNRPPLPEILAGCSLEFRSRDVDNMAEQIRSCLEDEMRRGELKAGARERAQDFSWENCAKETYCALVEW